MYGREVAGTVPIYEFRCGECGHRFEELCRFDEEGDSIKCPSCGHVGARRLISVFAAHGLENGHHGVGKRWGSSGGGASSSSSSSSGDSSSSSSTTSTSSAAAD